MVKMTRTKKTKTKKTKTKNIQIKDKDNKSTSFVKHRSGGGPVKCGLKGGKICLAIRFHGRQCQLTKRSRPMRINVPINAM